MARVPKMSQVGSKWDRLHDCQALDRLPLTTEFPRGVNSSEVKSSTRAYSLVSVRFIAHDALCKRYPPLSRLLANTSSRYHVGERIQTGQHCVFGTHTSYSHIYQPQPRCKITPVKMMFWTWIFKSYRMIRIRDANNVCHVISGENGGK